MKAFLISDLHIDHYLGSSPSIPKIQQLLNPYLLPADILIVAGDISNHSKSTIKTIEALSELYPKVLWVNGNHDMVSYNQENSFVKMDRISKSIKSTNSTFLNGNVVKLGERVIGGSMGQCDFSYSEKHFGISKETMSKYWKEDWYDGRYWNIGNVSPLEIFNTEYNKLYNCVDEGATIMVSHFGPMVTKIPPQFHNKETGYFYFDGSKIIQKMPSGSIWCFGHTHTHIKHDLGNVLLLCNPFGYPNENRYFEHIPKEEFLFDI